VSGEIEFFDAQILGDRLIESRRKTITQIASTMNPDGTWQTPDDSDTDFLTPVNAIQCLVIVQSSDSDASAWVSVTNKETADQNSAHSDGYQFFDSNGSTVATANGWVTLGSSRQTRIGGADNDDNLLNAWFQGFKYER